MTVYVNGEGQNTTNSAGIVDGSIVNADINSSAAIAATKISGTALVASTADAKGDLYVASAADTVGRLAVGANGTVPVANSGDTAGIGYTYPEIGGLTSQSRAKSTLIASTIDPTRGTAANAMADGTLYLCALHIPYDATITGLKWFQTTQGSTTADNNNKIGLYSSNGTTLTIVASSTDDGELWDTASNNTVGSKAFTTPYAAQAGTYWAAALHNQSAQATAPAIARGTAMISGGLSNFSLTNGEKLTGVVSTQTDLPATQAFSGVSVNNVVLLLAAY